MSNMALGSEAQAAAREQPAAPRHTVTLSGSRGAVATYGVVEFLRAHLFARVLVATIGVVLAIIGVMTFVGYRLPGIAAGVSPMLAIFLTPWLLWAATVSGPEFKLVFPAEQASKERQQAEQQFAASSTPEDALALDLKRLNEYYQINQGQARSSFGWAIFAMFLGLGTIIAGVWVFYFRTPQPDIFMTGLSTGAGCLVNAISGLFLYLHSRTQERSLYYYQQLAAMQKLSMAIRLVDAHQDATQQRTARDLVIKELLAMSREVARGSGGHSTLPIGSMADADN